MNQYHSIEGCRTPSPGITTLALVLGCIVSWPASAQLEVAGNQQVFQNEVGGVIEAGDRFGESLVSGDFDGDGIDDLAIGAPGEAITTIGTAGAVFALYGAPGGLGTGPRSPLLLHQDVDGVAGQSEVGDRFGSVLASGDFNGDGRDELVVGIPSEDVLTLVDAGAVQVFLGTSGGLTPLGNVLLTRDSFDSLDDLEGFRFGSALAVGELLGDAHQDLLIGVPGSSLAPLYEGAAIQLAGSATGLDPSTSFQSLVPASDSGDRVGAAVAVGDVNGDGGDGDLIFGAPLAEPGAGNTDQGTVWTLNEGTFGYRPIPLVPGGGSHFGSPIVLGDFTGAGYPQILAGAPAADADLVEDAGAAVVYDVPNQRFTYVAQESSIFFGTPDAFDRFGEVLAVGDFDGDGIDDAAFGVPGEDLTATGGGNLVDAGIVQILPGSANGLSFANNQLFTLSLVGLSIFANDNFGGALAAGDFNGDGVDDLAIGVPGAIWQAQPETGFVQILYGFSERIFSDGFESGDTSTWE